MSQQEKNQRYPNESVAISDRITVKHVPVRQEISESVEAGFVDWYGLIIIAGTVLNLVRDSYEITDWFLNRLQRYDWKIKMNNSEITTKDELQKTLDEFMKSNSD